VECGDEDGETATELIVALASLIARFIRSTCPLVQGRFRLASRYSILCSGQM
jgi:hypothetical protein